MTKQLEIVLILKFRAFSFELGKLVIPIVLPQENCLFFPTIKCSVFMTITRWSKLVKFDCARKLRFIICIHFAVCETLENSHFFCVH